MCPAASGTSSKKNKTDLRERIVSCYSFMEQAGIALGELQVTEINTRSGLSRVYTGYSTSCREWLEYTYTVENNEKTMVYV